ncbi:MAG: ECF transporter S component [Selenomonadaceae bacterium]|nr:ECF transporter S component [Selenomonadaceae bacterium]
MAMMTAFVFVATFVPKIPIPLGYAHLGDAAIFLAIIFCGRRVGIFSGVIGSALADFMSGFPIWILPTVFIKATMAETFWRLREKNFLLALIISSLIMTAGYTLTGAILYDSLSAGLASTPGLLLKSAVNIFVAIILSAAVKNRGGVHEKS